jgi:hypothetical protein
MKGRVVGVSDGSRSVQVSLSHPVLDRELVRTSPENVDVVPSFSWSECGEMYHGREGSREEAAHAAIDEAEHPEDGFAFYTARTVPTDTYSILRSVADGIAERAVEELSETHADETPWSDEEWPDDPADDELRRGIYLALRGFVLRTGLPPTWAVTEEKRHKVVEFSSDAEGHHAKYTTDGEEGTKEAEWLTAEAWAKRGAAQP